MRLDQGDYKNNLSFNYNLMPWSSKCGPLPDLCGPHNLLDNVVVIVYHNLAFENHQMDVRRSIKQSE